MEVHKYFSINEISVMKNNEQLDMLIEKNEENPDTNKKDKIYIRYFLKKSIRSTNINEMINDLFISDEVLTKTDTLYIIVKDEPNDTIKAELEHIWEKDGYFVVVQNIKRLQFNIMKMDLRGQLIY